MAVDTIPVTIITGFLGSGKSTLINRLLTDERLQNTVVIINEFGEIGLDHLLVESAFDEMVLMDNGCLCCSVRGDLVDTLTDLLAQAKSGAIPPFDRVMVETTGLADPGPIAQALASDPGVAERFALHGIVTTVDGENGAATLQAHDEARAQAAMADLLILTKADVAGGNLAQVRARLRDVNPDAQMIEAAHGRVDPDAIVSLDPARLRIDGPQDSAEHAHDHAGHQHGGGSRIQSVSLVLAEPVSWEALSDWLEWMTALRGPDLLRVKGLVSVEGCAGPVLIHGVQHVFYAPQVLDAWPDADERSRLVVIARDIPAEAIRASFGRFTAVGLAA